MLYLCSMEIFYANEINGGLALLDADESAHCVRVLRHRVGDEVTVVDGIGNMYRCRLSDDSPKGAAAEILETVPGWGGHSYSLHMAVCPTKNNDRFEWFVEEATELGVDVVSPVIGGRSERKVFKAERSRKIALSAMKQSHKACKPVVNEMCSFKDFITKERKGRKFIAHCYAEVDRKDLFDELATIDAETPVTVLVGPEGDFSIDEVREAMKYGFTPISLGKSRLRIEAAALYAAMCAQLICRKD